jgi:hypothetical protein
MAERGIHRVLLVIITCITVKFVILMFRNNPNTVGNAIDASKTSTIIVYG